MATPSVLITPEGIFRLQAEEIDAAHYFQLLRERLNMKPAVVHLGDVPGGMPLNRLTAMFDASPENTVLTGFMGELKIMDFLTEGVTAAGTDPQNQWVTPHYGVRPGNGIQTRWTFDPDVAWPGQNVKLVFGRYGERAGLWAVKQGMGLKRLPMSNTYGDGLLCMNCPGSLTARGVALCALAMALVDQFTASSFSQDMPPDHVLAADVFRYEFNTDTMKMDQLSATCPFERLQTVAPAISAGAELIAATLENLWRVAPSQVTP
jgi:hypothetical protein